MLASELFLLLILANLCREKACWLGSWYIWAFKGFVTVVIAGNLVALTVGLQAACKVTNRRKLSSWMKIRSWFRNCFILTFLLGITWILGYFNNLGVEAQYIFVVLNASSGNHSEINTKVLCSKIYVFMQAYLFWHTALYSIHL